MIEHISIRMVADCLKHDTNYAFVWKQTVLLCSWYIERYE